MMAAIALSVASVSAQKGTWYLGTTGMSPFGKEVTNFSGQSFKASPFTGFSIKSFDNKTKETSFGIAPEAGYFIHDNFAVGLGAFYTHSKTKPDGASGVILNTFGFNPYARYYFFGSSSIRLYTQLDVRYASGKFNTTGAKSQYVFGVGIKPGISCNLSRSVALTATYGNLGYEKVKNSYDKFGLDLDSSSLNFGFTVAL